MKNYAKIQNGKIKKLTKKFISFKEEVTVNRTGESKFINSIVFNPTEDVLKAAGWKELVDEKPTAAEGKKAVADGFEELEDKITIKYKLVDVQ